MGKLLIKKILNLIKIWREKLTLNRKVFFKEKIFYLVNLELILKSKKREEKK